MASNIAEDEFNQIAKKSAKNLAQEKDQQKEPNPNFFSNNKTSPLNTPLKNAIPKKQCKRRKGVRTMYYRKGLVIQELRPEVILRTLHTVV